MVSPKWNEVYTQVQIKMRGPFEGEPSTFIQWKGTDVCMDLDCVCGFHSHRDRDFCYSVKCPGCDQIWRLGTQVQLVRITPEQSEVLGCEQNLEIYPDEIEDLNAHRQSLGLPPYSPEQ